jgi:hypothetical protein
VGVGVAVGMGVGVAVGGDVGVAVTTTSFSTTLGVGVGSRVAVGIGGSSLPPQPTNSTSAVVRRSNGMTLSFMPLYYPKRLLSGSAEVTAYWQCESDDPNPPWDS